MATKRGTLPFCSLLFKGKPPPKKNKATYVILLARNRAAGQHHWPDPSPQQLSLTNEKPLKTGLSSDPRTQKTQKKSSGTGWLVEPPKPKGLTHRCNSVLKPQRGDVPKALGEPSCMGAEPPGVRKKNPLGFSLQRSLQRVWLPLKESPEQKKERVKYTPAAPKLPFARRIDVGQIVEEYSQTRNKGVFK